ncbi:hypothetical protein SAZ11_35175 [Streptomyces sp. FXJ1.4098]|nr:hypothetical protein [Streptomyces sp. FXJ1.4098]
MVNPLNQDGKVQALYASWGYAVVGTARSSPEAPVLTVMVRPVRPETAAG